MSQPLRLGIVGCGEVVQICHLPSLALVPDLVTITAVCDVSQTVVDAIGTRLGVARRARDYRDLIGLAEVDAVLVSVPHAFHSEITLAALAAGKHVLVEKPMCLTLREADAIIAAQRQTGLVVQVGTMRRYAPAFIEARRLVSEMGPVRLARVHDVLGRNALVTEQASRVARGADVSEAVIAAGRQRQAALLDEALGSSPPDLRTAYQMLLGLSTHDTSTMRELLGQPRAVAYAAQRQGGRYLTAAFDYGDFVCQFATGVDEIPRAEMVTEVYGAERVLRVTYDTPYVRHLPVRLTVTAANGRGGVIEQVTQPDWGDPFVEEWRAFCHHVTQRGQPKNGPADFRQDLELYAAMIDLMRRNG